MPELGKIGLDTAVQGVPVKKKQSVLATNWRWEGLAGDERYVVVSQPSRRHVCLGNPQSLSRSSHFS